MQTTASRRLKKCGLLVLASIGIAVPVDACVLTPYRIHGNCLSPEIRDGSWAMVYHLTSDFQQGDLLVYRDGGHDFLARCTAAGPAELQVTRDAAEFTVPRSKVVGKIVAQTR